MSDIRQLSNERFRNESYVSIKDVVRCVIRLLAKSLFFLRCSFRVHLKRTVNWIHWLGQLLIFYIYCMTCQGLTGWFIVKTTNAHQDQWQLVFKPSSSSCSSHVHGSQHDGCERHPQHLCLKSMHWIKGCFLFGISRENSFGHNRTI